MKRATLGLLVLSSLASLALVWRSAPARAQGEMGPSNTQVLCEALVKQQVSALNVENAQGVMMVFHPEAPNRQELLQTLTQQFRKLDLRYKLLETHFVAEDGDYAYLRVREHVDGSHEQRPFQGETEDLLVFKRHQHTWKAWTSARLDAKSVPLAPRGGGGQPQPGGR
ncbi:MAG: nuclear transport factor 2 family protein [Planctomycetota bacterium]